MTANEVTQACTQFTLRLDAFVQEVRREANSRFIHRLNALRRAGQKPLDGEVAKAAIVYAVQKASFNQLDMPPPPPET
jgi:hypothetical protein